MSAEKESEGVTVFKKREASQGSGCKINIAIYTPRQPYMWKMTLERERELLGQTKSTSPQSNKSDDKGGGGGVAL